MKLVKCIKKGSDLKVIVVDDEESGFVQFPKDIREENKIFAVDGLVKIKNYWKTTGNIYELTEISSSSNKNLKEQEYIEVIETNDNEGEQWSFFIKKDDKNVPFLLKLIDKYKELDEDTMGEFDYRDISSKDMNILLKRKSKTTYMDEFNLVKEIDFTDVEKNINNYSSCDDILEVLYKGRIFLT